MTGVHPSVHRDQAEVAENAVVGAVAVLEPGCRVGPRCSVGPHASIGRDTTLAAGADVGAGARIGADVRVEPGARVGANAVVASGVAVGRGAVVEPAAYVVGDVPATAIVRGNPAIIVGYVVAAAEPQPASMSADQLPLDIAAGCRLWPLPRFRDLRGSLVAVEHERDLPFSPARTFLVFDVPSEEVRGEHAHRWCAQVLVAAHGAMSVVVDDGETSAEVRLDHPDRGLLIPPGVWGVQYRFTSDAVLCVFASHPYDAADYIRDYEEFLEYVSSSHASTTASG